MCDKIPYLTLPPRADPDSNLAERVDAYNLIFDELMHNLAFRKNAVKIVENSWRDELPQFIATNYFWGNAGNTLAKVKVVDRASGNSLSIPTANFMKTMITKKNVPAPGAYLIPAEVSKVYIPLLTQHGMDYQVLEEENSYTVEPCSLLRVENDYDPVYNRYAGRQIVERLAPVVKTFQAGTVLVHCDKREHRKNFLLLGPTMMYGLYQYEQFRNTVSNDNIIPVYRIVN